MRALIVEHGLSRGALAAARSLDRAGWTVDVVASGPSFTAHSRSVRRCERIRFPDEGAGALVEAVRRMIRDAGTEIIFPVDETQLLVLSRHRDELDAILPYPPHEVVERATDRLEQVTLAARCGLAPPRTTEGRFFYDHDDRELVVVKARTPGLLLRGSSWGRVESRVGTPRQAADWIAEIESNGLQTIAQDRLQGHLASITVLSDADGAVVAQVQQAAHRTWPPAAGSSVRASTVPVDPELSRCAQAFLQALEWRGLVQLQFIVDADDSPHFIDFNPRFYGSLGLAINSGVDFPVIWANSVTGRAHSINARARVGARYQWLGGELRLTLHQRRPGFIRDIGATVAWGRTAVHPIWSVRDPGPAIRGAMAMLRQRPGSDLRQAY